MTGSTSPQLDPISVAAAVDLVRGELIHGSAEAMIDGIAAAAEAGAGDICFLARESLIEHISDTQLICLTLPDLAHRLPPRVITIAVPDPKSSLGLVMRAMIPEEALAPGIHPSAVVADTAHIGEGACISAHAVIDAGVTLGEGTVIGAGVHIGRGCVIGAHTAIDSNTTIMDARIGAHCHIGPNTVIGFTGFGITRQEGNVVIPHIGRVMIGDRCHIGASVTIDRGFIEDTVLGDNVMVDNQTHIAHNVEIGDGTIICGQTGLAGGVRIGRNNVIGAQAGMADHVRIGDGNMLAGRTGITRDFGSGQVLGGFPAVPAAEFRRQVAALRRLARGKAGPRDGSKTGNDSSKGD
ncbi:UDP-3-O-(3-hydroxymyristoyl)glucosamine N-acyltransferase [Alphaproteobacteria bacterium LSUCC0684]